MLNQHLDLQEEAILGVILVILMKLIVFLKILLSFLAHFFRLVDNILIFDFQQDLPSGSIQRGEVLMSG